MNSGTKVRYVNDIAAFFGTKRLTEIADSTTAALITEVDDITGFLPFMVNGQVITRLVDLFMVPLPEVVVYAD